jgi:hypothetical protein
MFAKKMAFAGPNRPFIETKIIECNYDTEILETINPKVKTIIKSCIMPKP